jgi:protein-tyrosine-phosphatase
MARLSDEDAHVTDRVYNVLFLCTGISARSIIAECTLNRHGQGRFRAFSAGSHANGWVHPYALDLLRNLNHPTEHLRSKSWDEFAVPDAPKLDFVFTVCDDAANESCPVWPGQPMTAHWGMPDPAAVEGPEAVKRAAFAETCRMLTNRISVFTSLPIESLDRLSLQKRLHDIGERREARLAERA